MRAMVRIAALMLVFVLLLAPAAAEANGPCPDDPELSKDCLAEAPPFFVVVNRDFEALDRAGTGCQPIILNHPDCEGCCVAENDEVDGLVSAECLAATDDLELNVCPLLAERVEWTDVDQTEVVYEMCCDCATDAEGVWKYRVHLLYEDGTCPIDEVNPDCYEGLPPGTGIDLPAPVIVGGLALMGAALVAAGALLRRRAPRVA